MLGVADTVVLTGVVTIIKVPVAVIVPEMVVVAQSSIKVGVLYLKLLVALKNVVGAVVMEIAVGHSRDSIRDHRRHGVAYSDSTSENK